ncbi:MAG: DNA primase [Thauera sp.]|jgi:DNA primase|nr:DNA primase [Thauera sp.]
MIPQSFIQELLSRVDIVDVIERHLPLKKSGANYFACCPFHGEKSASFSVSPSKQFYHCFGCGVHGSALGFLMEYSGLGFVDAVKELASQVGMAVPEVRDTTAPAADQSAPLYHALESTANFYHHQLKHSPAARSYLQQRDLSPATIERFGLGYAPEGWQALAEIFPAYDSETLVSAGLVIVNEQGRRYDRFRDRLIFPIHDRRGRIIAFGGRVLGKGEPKYLNSPETPLFEKGRELYGLHLARQAIRSEGHVLVVEGYMDVVTLAQHGLENVVATLGTATTAEHIHRLLRQTDHIVFCFDGDAAGRRAAWRALENALGSLRDDARLSFLLLTAEHDPDSFLRSEGAAALRAAAKAAQPLTSFLVDELCHRHAVDSAEGRASLVHEALPLLSRVSAPLLQLQMIKAIAEVSSFTQSELELALESVLHSTNARTNATSSPRTTSTASPSSAAADSPHFSGRSGPRRPQARPRPGLALRGRRQPPSTAATLLRLIMQHPTLAIRLPIELVPDHSAEGLALVALIDHFSLGDSMPASGLGGLIEKFRDTPHAPTLARVAAALVDSEFDETVVDTLFEDSLAKLQADSLGSEITALLELDRSRGLDQDGRLRLAALLSEKSRLGRR